MLRGKGDAVFAYPEDMSLDKRSKSLVPERLLLQKAGGSPRFLIMSWVRSHETQKKYEKIHIDFFDTAAGTFYLHLLFYHRYFKFQLSKITIIKYNFILLAQSHAFAK